MIHVALLAPRRWLGALTLASLGAMVAAVPLAPQFLLLRGALADDTRLGVGLALLAGSLVGAGRAAWRVRQYRFVLRAVALGSRAVEPQEAAELQHVPWHLTRAWLESGAAGLALMALTGFPEALDATTRLSAALLSMAILAVAALPLHAVLTAITHTLLELLPGECLTEALEAAWREGEGRRSLPRRVVASVVTPVAFLAVGAALIENAHLRRADERHREEAAAGLARAALEPTEGVVPWAGIAAAQAALAAGGFDAERSEQARGYRVDQGPSGERILDAPLGTGSVRVRFAASTVSIMGVDSLLLAVLAIAVAASAGVRLGRALGDDLERASHRVRVLGTDAALSGAGGLVGAARFRVVADLVEAIGQLAERFRTFARGEERAARAREQTARMRGLFFASVSHDLKSPLNSILGFTDLVRTTETLTPGQLESLDVIHGRGRELLALIETILDSARVEAGLLGLHRESVTVQTLLDDALAGGRDLAPATEGTVVVALEGGDLRLDVDRTRLGRVLSTLVGHALRSSVGAAPRVTASPTASRVVIEAAVLNPETTAATLERLLVDRPTARGTAARGLSLGLALTRAVVELHGGTVRAVPCEGGAAFRVELPRGGPPDGDPAPAPMAP